MSWFNLPSCKDDVLYGVGKTIIKTVSDNGTYKVSALYIISIGNTWAFIGSCGVNSDKAFNVRQFTLHFFRQTMLCIKDSDFFVLDTFMVRWNSLWTYIPIYNILFIETFLYVCCYSEILLNNIHSIHGKSTFLHFSEDLVHIVFCISKIELKR